MSPSEISTTELQALIRLLDDPEPEVRESVLLRFRRLGHAAVRPHLEAARAEAVEPLRSVIADLIHDLHLGEVVERWSQVMERPEPDLEDGALALARYHTPDLEEGVYRRALDGFAERAAPYVRQAHRHERALVLGRFLHEVLGFDGNRTDYDNPLNMYLDRVIDRRTGIPISLSVVFLLVGRRLALPVFGVGMPAHFLVKYHDEHMQLFIDPFDRGLPVKKSEAARRLVEAGIRPRPVYFAAVGTREILLRMVRNLARHAERQGEAARLADFRRLLDPWEGRID